MNLTASQNPTNRTGTQSSAGHHFDHYRHAKIIKRASSYKPFSMRSLQPLVVTILLLCFSHAIANDSLSEPMDQDKQHADTSEIGIGIGVLIFLGPDFRIFYRQTDSPWVFGIRYLDIEDDFVNESAVGLPGDESDREYTKRAGIYFDYLFTTQADAGSLYLTGALYKTTKTLECLSESDSDSATGPYFGGGYRGSFGEHFGYNIGLLFSPFAKLEATTTDCSSESISTWT